MNSEKESGRNHTRRGGDLSHISAAMEFHRVARKCADPDCGEEFQAVAELGRRYCDKCSIKKAAQEEEDRRAQQAALAAQHYRALVTRARIPPRWQPVNFENSNSSINRKVFGLAKIYAESFNKDSGTLIFYSEGYGTGKTHLAVCIANYVLHILKRPVLFKKARDLMLDIRRTFSDRGDSTEADILDQTLSVDLLVLDDVGVDVPSQWLEGTYWTVFDRRLDWQLPLVITTNYPLEGSPNLGDRIGYGAVSRLVQLCGGRVIDLSGPDLR